MTVNPAPELGSAPAVTTSLSLDEAVSRLAAANAPPEVVKDQTEAPKPVAEEPTEDEEPTEEVPEGDETEDEPDAEDQVEEDDEDDEPAPAKGKFAADDARVRLADGTFATVADLKKGSLLNADYTRKTQEVAELRRSTESQSAAAKQREETAVKYAEYAVNLIKSVMPPAPDPTMAISTNPNYNPLKYQEDMVAYQQWAQHLNELDQYQQRTQQGRQAETAEQARARADKEWELAVEKLPRLKDPGKLNAFAADAKKFGANYGYSAEEIASIVLDHRQLVVIDKAIKWDKLQANKAKVPAKVEPRPPVKTSGKRVTTDERQARDASGAINRLKSTGRMADAVSAYMAITPKGP